MSDLTHLDEHGAARMVDISSKPASERRAIAEATITLSRQAFEAIRSGEAPKGDVLATARIAGIMAAKKTSDLIPLCHALALTAVKIDFEFNEKDHCVRTIVEASTTGQTGVEMEALTAASVAALAIYDMVKAIDRTASIGPIRLVAKSGGKSGRFTAPSDPLPSQESAKRMAATAEKTQRTSKDPERQRVAFRAFMNSRRLRATEWARTAGVAPSQIYAYLTGRTRAIPDDIAERLARAASVRVEDMFR